MSKASMPMVLITAALVAGCDDKSPAKPVPSTSALPAKSIELKTEAKPVDSKPEPGGIKNVPRDGELKVDRESSSLSWTDTHVSADDNAHFQQYEATLGMKDGKPVSLTFTFKSASLTVKDKPTLRDSSKEDVLDAVNNPKASFLSKQITPTSTDQKYEVQGTMTFRLTPKPVSFPMTVETQGMSFRVKGEFTLVGANHGTTGKPGVHLDLVFPFPK